MRPGAGGKLAGNSEAQKSSETHQEELDGTREKILYLTRGGLLGESGEEVSRRHSSEEAGSRPWSEGRKKQDKAREETEGKLRRDLKSKGATTAVVTRRVQRAEAVEPWRAWRRRSQGGTLRNF